MAIYGRAYGGGSRYGGELPDRQSQAGARRNDKTKTLRQSQVSKIVDAWTEFGHASKGGSRTSAAQRARNVIRSAELGATREERDEARRIVMCGQRPRTWH